jgi:hypothetical protein
MAEEKGVVVEVVRDGYTFGKTGIPRGTKVRLTQAQFEATQKISPPYVRKVEAGTAKEQGEVQYATARSIGPAAQAEYDKARSGGSGETQQIFAESANATEVARKLDTAAKSAKKK